MKKVIALALSVVMALSLVACGGETAKAPAKFKVGMGHNISAKMTDATADKAGSAQVDTTMLVAAFDAEGKVTSVSIDVAQQKLGVNADGTTADAAKADLAGYRVPSCIRSRTVYHSYTGEKRHGTA